MGLALSSTPKVCSGPDRSKSDPFGHRLNISWDPLPCHLQNGADITGYSPYSCSISSSLLNDGQTHTFQVAVRNRNGPFSDPIFGMLNQIVIVSDLYWQHYNDSQRHIIHFQKQTV